MKAGILPLLLLSCLVLAGRAADAASPYSCTFKNEVGCGGSGCVPGDAAEQGRLAFDPELRQAELCLGDSCTRARSFVAAPAPSAETLLFRFSVRARINGQIAWTMAVGIVPTAGGQIQLALADGGGLMIYAGSCTRGATATP